MWMQEREGKWDATQEDDKLWGVGITNMIAYLMKPAVPGQEVRKKGIDKTVGTDGGGLGTSQHSDTMQEA